MDKDGVFFMIWDDKVMFFLSVEFFYFIFKGWFFFSFFRFKNSSIYFKVLIIKIKVDF